MLQSETEINYHDSPVAWFVMLETARAKGDFEKAAQAKRELERLGVFVKYRKAGIRNAAGK